MNTYECIVEESKDNKLVMKIIHANKHRYIGSKYSVKGEVDKFLSQFDEVTGDSIIIVFGIGTGEHILGLQEILGNGDRILIIEPCIEIYNEFKKLNNRIILDDQRINISIFDRSTIKNILDNFIYENEINKIKMVSFANYDSLFETEYKEIIITLKKVVFSKKSSKDTMNFFSKTFFENFIRNMQNLEDTLIINEFKDVFKNKPAIIVSAGPSLENNIDQLINYQDNFVIICGARSLKSLVARGINPDFICAVDPQDITYTLMEDFMKKDIPLIFCDITNYKIVKEYSGKKILFSNYGMEEYLEKIIGMKIESILQGGSVAHVCMGSAVLMGCNPIIFIGQDLAYTGEKFYADSAVNLNNYGDRVYEQLKDNIEEWCKLEDYSIYVEDIYGNPVRTSKMLNLYREEFSHLINQCEGIDFINCTEGGANIEGTEVMLLGQAIEKYNEKCDKKVTDMIFNKSNRIDNKVVTKNLELIEKNLIVIREKCERGIVLSEQMYQYYLSPLKININSVFKELDGVDFIIQDMQNIGLIGYLLAPKMEEILNDKKYIASKSETEREAGIRISSRTKALYSKIKFSVDEALEVINSN